ncbi:hypothetical protein PRVXT_002446 [Proteinivorax tanatarense]|uniref:DUF4342 domain-containing protein n=1 Tax=Proteinivorax tanatarense TaxID=1260629 RepID=A0AAU7VKP6_9FIRM
MDKDEKNKLEQRKGIEEQGEDKWKKRADRMGEIGEKLQNAGDKMNNCGCLMTVVITIPVILFLFLGPLGLLIALLIIVAYIAGNKKI